MSWLNQKCALVPIDFSDESLAAVDAALELMPQDSTIHVIHVAADLLLMEPGIAWDDATDEARAQNLTAEFHKRFSDPKYARTKFHVAFGDAGHQIVDYAEEIDAGIIIMPSHGHTGLTRVLIGSVAERVVRLAHCPVLVLKKPE